jgi:hypothetical protein
MSWPDARTRTTRRVCSVDRNDPSWNRIRAACCNTSSRLVNVDDHADQVWLTIEALKNTNGRPAQSLDGTRAPGGQKECTHAV